MIDNEIVAFYKQHGSIKSAARQYNISEQTCRRILISAGLDVCELQHTVKQLIDAGLSEQDISRKLKISIKAVQSYLPYKKSSYRTAQPDNKLKTIRLKHSLTQRQVADKLGVSQNEYSRWEIGKVTPRIEMLKKIAEIYQVSIDSLI